MNSTWAFMSANWTLILGISMALPCLYFLFFLKADSQQKNFAAFWLAYSLHTGLKAFIPNITTPIFVVVALWTGISFLIHSHQARKKSPE